MLQSASILAAGEDTTIKVVVGLAVLVFWLVSQAAAAMSKKPYKYRAPPQTQVPTQPIGTGPISAGQRHHPDLPGPRRGVATKTGLPNPMQQNRPPVRVQQRPIAMPRATPPALPKQIKPAQIKTPRPPVKNRPQPVPAISQPIVNEAPALPRTVAGRTTSVISDKGSKSAGRPAQGANPLSRGQFLGALLKPRNLRKAYMLSEILQPPIALRE